MELPGDHDCLAAVTEQQVDLIERLSETIRRFEDKVGDHRRLRPDYELLLTLPGVDEQWIEHGAVLTMFWSRRRWDGARSLHGRKDVRPRTG